VFNISKAPTCLMIDISRANLEQDERGRCCMTER